MFKWLPYQSGFAYLPVLILSLVLIIVAVGFNTFSSLKPLEKRQQPPLKRLGLLLASDLQTSTVDGIKEGLKQLGYVEGENILYDIKNPKGDRELTKKLASDIVASKPDVMIPVSTTATTAILEVNKDANLPTIFVDVGNIKSLKIADLRHPGGNITGIASDSLAVSGKRMEILKELVPDAKLLGILINPKHVSYEENIKVLEEASQALGVKLKLYNVSSVDDLKSVLDQLAKDKPDGMMTTTESILSENANIIAESLRVSKIPSIDFNEEKGINAGYLLLYGVSRFETGKQGARLIDKVLKGENPGEIPVEFSTALKLDVNTSLAEEFGITLPESILLRVGKVSE